MEMDGLMMIGWGGVEERGWMKGPWTPEEDKLLSEHVSFHGEGRWSHVARCTGLNRSGKSCRLRWVNYLKPGLQRGNLTPQEEGIIIELHALWGNRWSIIARYLPGRTDNDIKNYWRTHFKAKDKCAEKQLKRKAQILKEKQELLEDVEHDHVSKKTKSADNNSTNAPYGNREALLACNSELGSDIIIATDELQQLAQETQDMNAHIQSCPALNQLGDTSIWSFDDTAIVNIGSEDDQELWGELGNLVDDRCPAQDNNGMERQASCNYSNCLNRLALHQNQAMHIGANKVNNFYWDEDIDVDKVFYGGLDYIF